MNVLALESGAKSWGLAIVHFGSEMENAAKPLAITVETEPRKLAQELFARIGSTLDAAQMTLEDIDALAVGIGPGSWTGLRVGLTAMKTLAQTRAIAIVGVPAFDAVAQAIWRSRDEEETCLLLTTGACRPGEYYAKIFECGPDYLGIVQKEWIGSAQILADTMSTEALARGLETAPLLSGGGSENIAEILRARREEYSALEPEFQNTLIEIAIAGAIAVASDQADDPMTLAPLYLAPSNAERNLLNR